MATYECSKCGMSVNATCGKCEDIGDGILNLEFQSKRYQNVQMIMEKLNLHYVVVKI